MVAFVMRVEYSQQVDLTIVIAPSEQIARGYQGISSLDVNFAV